MLTKEKKDIKNLKALKGYYKISRHYRWALGQVFDEMGYQYALIVEGTALYSVLFVGHELHDWLLQMTWRWLRTSFPISQHFVGCWRRTRVYGVCQPGMIMENQTMLTSKAMVRWQWIHAYCSNDLSPIP